MAQFKNLWQRLPKVLDRAGMLRILEEENEAARQKLAGRSDAAPEVLYYLAAEGSAAIRRAIAANPSAPPHANRLLADDADDDVRVELAHKVGQLLPQMPADASLRLRDLTLETLERLARDSLPRVRAALAEEIKALDCVPPRIIKALARDIEQVAAPILEYSPLLSDADLLEILSTAQASFALLAVARRRPLHASVAEVIATALDVPSVSAMLSNSGAQMRQQTLDKIAQHAETITDWHLPLVLRNDLPQRTVRRLAGFVSKALIEKLALRHDLDEKTRVCLREKMKARIEAGDEPVAGAAPKPPDLKALQKAGKLDDGFVEGAIERGSRELVCAALAQLAGLAPDIVARIFESRLPKPITALVWRAGLGMRVAFKIQTLMLHLPSQDVLPARGGVRFPLTEDEMRALLGYFGAA
jgi:uncharacterized protein (DUF2336 family)